MFEHGSLQSYIYNSLIVRDCAEHRDSEDDVHMTGTIADYTSLFFCS